MTGEIEVGIPIPPPSRSGRKESTDGITAKMREMKVGDSIFIEDGYGLRYKGAGGYASYVGIKITRRKVEGGFRIWRIA